MQSLPQDLRYALRQLWKSKGFALTAFFTIALGVGAVTAVFRVVDTVLLKPYPFHDPGKLVVWRESIREIQNVSPLLPDNYRHYQNLRTHANSIQDAAIVQTAGFSVSTGTDHPQMAEGLAVSPNFFSVLGVPPFMGRGFTEEEGQSGKNNVVVLTWSAWQRLFHGNPSAIGSTVRIGSDAETVVGVMPESFRFPVLSTMPGEATHGSTDRYEVLKPLVPRPDELTANEGEFNFLVIARLKPGISLQQAQSELDGIEKSTAAADHLEIHLSVIVEPFAEEIVGGVSKPLWLLLAAVASVLLMACVNLANLQLARGMARDHETALRSALGARRSRLFQGVLTENLILGVGGGLAGMLLADLGEKLFVRIASVLPRLNEVHLSFPILAFALGLSILTSLSFGMLPALRSLRVTPQSALQSNSTRLSVNRQAVRTRRLLVAVQIACSITLLVVTGLITRSFSRLLSQNRHFNSERVVMAEAELNNREYSSGPGVPDNFGSDPGSLARAAMVTHVLEKIRTLPGVESAAITSVMPLTGDMSVIGLRRTDHPVPQGQGPMANRRFISPGYFGVMGIPMISGRDFTEQDRENPRVIILSEKAAKAVWPDENPLGHKVEHWGRIYTVIGVAADARINDLKRNVAVFYLPVWDFPPFVPVFLARSSRSADILGPEMRQTIWSVDPDISIPTVTSLDEMVGESVATERFQTVILSSFGGAALLLAVLGIYGVLAYSVSLRTQEFGIRIALGSSKQALIRLVLLEASRPMAVGLVLGLLGVAVATRWVRSLLYETSPVDPWTIVLSVAVLGAAALLASLVPVRNAMSIDPMRVLRGE
jgi:predicted permease